MNMLNGYKFTAGRSVITAAGVAAIVVATALVAADAENDMRADEQPLHSDDRPFTDSYVPTGSGAGIGYDLSWHKIAGGGETFSTGGGYQLGGTIGQHDAGVMSGGGYTLAGGFWAGGVDIEPGPSCLGDLNGDTVVDVSDLLILLGAWGPCADPNNCPADLNNDTVVDVSDLLILLGAWGACPE